MNIGEWMTKWATLQPQKTAMFFDDQPVSYRDLNAATNRLANLLLSMGVAKGDRAAVLLHNCSEYIEIVFALAKIGAILIPLNFRLVPRELEYIIGDCGATTIFFEKEFTDSVGSLREKVLAGRGNYLFLGDGPPPWAVPYHEACAPQSHAEPQPAEAAGDEDIQIIMYTSGTTGMPKGAMLSHRKTFFNSLNADIFYGLTRNDVMLVSRALFHSGGLLVETFPTIYKGGTILVKRRFSPEDILKATEKYRVTILELAATVLRFILEQCDVTSYDLSSVKVCITGGERVPPTLVSDCNEKGMTVSQIYGQTETSTLTWLPKEDALRKIGSAGIPVFHGTVKVRNKNGEDVKPGEVGEIVVSGPITMSGYWGKPELTEGTIVDGWLHTGDLAKVDEEGFLYIVDREKDMFISGGENVYPAEIEKACLESAKVLNVAVIGVPDDKWGEAGVAFIVLKEGEAMTEEEAIQFLAARLAKFKVPKKVVFVDELPVNAAQKIMRNKLKQAYLEGLSSSKG